MPSTPTRLYQDNGAPETRMPRGFRLALLAVVLVLAVACAALWMRFGAQVFLDAALFAWRSCF